MRRADTEMNDSSKGSRVAALKRHKAIRCNTSTLHRFNGFALYEVLIGLTIFVVGVVALGHAVENCLNASTLNAEEDRVRQILSNRMAEIQATPGFPDAAKEFKVDTGYGVARLIQKSAPAQLKKEQDGTELTRINVVTLTAKWTRGGIEQSRLIEFYVYRAG
jgi:Tfp pilus assembly protein PilV